MTPCGDSWNTTKWCCGVNATGCCDNWDVHAGIGVELPLEFGKPTTSATAANSSTTVFTTATAPANSHGGLSGGAGVGVGVGVALGAVALLATAGFLVYRRQSTNKNSGPSSEHTSAPTVMLVQSKSTKRLHEIGSDAKLNELDDYRRVNELA